MKDYKTILEEILEMMEGDLQTLKTDEAKKYVSKTNEYKNDFEDKREDLKCIQD